MTTKKIKELDVPVDNQSGDYTAVMSFSTPSPGFVYVQLTDQDGNELWRELITESPVTLEANFSHTNLEKLILNRYESNAHSVTSYIFELYWSLPVDICSWITGLGGWEAITSMHVLDLLKARLGIIDLGFTVTSVHRLGVLNYRLDDSVNGDYWTGCTTP